MRAILFAVLIAAVAANAARAGEPVLAPGKAAGVKDAQMARDPRFYIVFGAGLVGAGIAIAATSGHHKIVTSTATTTTLH